MNKRRPLVLAISIGLVLATVAGVLGILHPMDPDIKAIRGDFDDRISRVVAMPAEDPVTKDRLIHELLENEDYKKYARALWLKLERRHGPIHQAAQADDAARKAVPPFLARCSALDGKSLAELLSLEDEARALQDEHGSTRFGHALAEVRSRLAKALAAGPKVCSEIDHFRILQDAQKDRLAGRFAAALSRIDEAAAKHPACEQFRLKLQNERGTLLASAGKAAEKLLADARGSRKEEGAQALERALPNYRGLPEEGRLRALLEELRRP